MQTPTKKNIRGPPLAGFRPGGPGSIGIARPSRSPVYCPAAPHAARSARMEVPPRGAGSRRLERKEALGSMQSSTTVACRALVMLACLIVIPLAAVFGTSLPKLVKALLEGRRGERAASAGDVLAEAPPFGSTRDPAPPSGPSDGTPAPAWPRDDLNVAPGWPTGPMARDSTPTGGLESVLAGVPARPLRSGTALASFESQVEPPLRSASSDWPDPFPPEPHPDARTDRDLVPVVEAGRFRSAGPASGGPVAESTPPQSPPGSDQFALIRRRLDELGATYYRLESWGNEGRLYRFYCRMAIGGSPNYTRYFEAKDPDALGAMAKVLREVESWRAVP